ncbi:hypothetical protein HCJ66_06875 [Listeria sp. FSL L7-1582]|uniref:hypothetical protein n=1 Tax=Listeria portnoyi TaxID=2713504 RepID=UPI00164DE5C6|nr:hypothetical protein [Listeria portnoyi]MBC6309275.1 hypothetical protein [Listeria portnoyi]
MDILEAKEIIENEGLQNYCFFCGNEQKADIVVINKSDSYWIVYTNSERAAKTSEKRYENESDALEDFIKRLRGDKAYRSYLA